MPKTQNHTSVADLNRANDGKLPGHLGLEVTQTDDGLVDGKFDVRDDLVAHTGYLLAGALLSVADILCAYGVSTAWPEGATGFTTIEVKCNFMGTVRSGAVACAARLVPGGRSTQVWDAEMTDAATGKRLALFRCTQMILYAKG